MSALEEYRGAWFQFQGQPVSWVRKDQADAAIAELEAENARLRVCGTCGEWYENGGRCYAGGGDEATFTDMRDPRHFTPPRWTPYWEGK